MEGARGQGEGPSHSTLESEKGRAAGRHCSLSKLHRWGHGFQVERTAMQGVRDWDHPGEPEKRNAKVGPNAQVSPENKHFHFHSYKMLFFTSHSVNALHP